MQKPPYIESRLLIAVALTMPLVAFTSGCQSTSSAAPASAAPSGESAGDDAALAARVKQALAGDPDLKSLPMSVATYRGVVQIAGYADSEAQIQKALTVARGVPGVQSVSNELHLRAR
jgi:osmotically-inducible protein OsmY